LQIASQMKPLYLFILLCAYLLISLAAPCKAQTVNIRVKSTDKKPLPGAAVQMTRVSDSVIKYSVTDQSGLASFNGLTNSLYMLKISYLGFQTREETIMVKPEGLNLEFRLKEDAVALGEVTVEAKRPLIRQEDDKMIVDPLPLINSSTNTLEILEKTPGLFVDQDGGIYLSSTSTAAIYINGRELKMSNQDISTLLRSLPPNSVQQIEVMRTPSTKYDAASSGGIINIVLKKGVKLGRFGSVSAGMNQGFYGNQFAGFSINGSGDKTTYYINANYNHNDRLEELNSFRQLKADTTLSQKAHIREQSHQAFLGYGLNYDIRKKINFSYDGRLNANFTKTATANNNQIKNIEQLLAQSDNQINNSSELINLQQDLEILWKIDTGGSEWDTKLSYNFNNNNSGQNYINSYSMPFGAIALGEGDNLQNRHFAILQSDVTYQFPYKIKLETGIKSSYQNYESKADYFIRQNDSLLSDPLRSNAFNYQENINSAYLQASKTFGKYLVVKAGVRMEYTYMSGHQSVPSDTSFVISRADWFPYIYISRRILKIFGIELKGYLIYRRTISRPGYQSLNPYIKYIDEFLYETGNPALKPQFTDNYEINVSYEDMPIVAFGQDFTRDIFSSVVYEDAGQKGVLLKTYDNLGKNRETYVRLMVGYPPGKKYFFALGAQYNYNHYDGFYDNQPLSFSHGSWRLYTFHSLTLWKHTKINLFGFMMINGQQNFYELRNFGQLNIGISQSFLNNTLNISVNARDILRTMGTKFELNQGSIYTYGDRYTDSQRIGINIRYNFGMKKKEERRGMIPFDEVE
jgi:iron complex outermembrane recepter protein